MELVVSTSPHLMGVVSLLASPDDDFTFTSTYMYACIWCASGPSVTPATSCRTCSAAGWLQQSAAWTWASTSTSWQPVIIDRGQAVPVCNNVVQVPCVYPCILYYQIASTYCTNHITWRHATTADGVAASFETNSELVEHISGNLLHETGHAFFLSNTSQG